MNNYNINDENYVNSLPYQEFLKENPSYGFLKIRAFAASGAIPITNLKVVVSKKIDNNNVIFFEGLTNESGTIEKISLPAPKLDLENMDVPNSATYDITATYNIDNINRVYKINIYADVCVVQNINIVPDTNLQVGEF